MILFKIKPLVGGYVSAAGLLFLVAFGPMIFMDKVQVDSTGIYQSTGFWFNQTEKGIEFKDLERVVITDGRDLKNRSIEIWIAEYKTGETKTVDPGDLWELSGQEIIAYMRQQGLKVDLIGR